MFDKIDKIIISELQKDGRAPLAEIGKKAGISHVAVRKRLKKLFDKNILGITACMNAEPIGGKIAVITAEVENYPRLQELIKLFKDCPRMIFLSTLSASNLMAIIFGENLSTLESTIGICSIRVQKGVRRSDVQIGDFPAYPKFLPLRIPSEREAEISPCGAICIECENFKNKKCLGCPATKFYNGLL